MTTALEVLTKARALIEKPENWTQGAYARSQSGSKVEYDSGAACQFCMLGSLYRVFGGSFGQPLGKAVQTIHDANKATYIHGIATFNDGGTHAEVLQAFDKAIELAKSETV